MEVISTWELPFIFMLKLNALFINRKYITKCTDLTCDIFTPFVHMDKRKLEDTKGMIRSPKSKDRKHNGKRKRQNITYKTNDRATQTPLKIWDELGCSRRVSSSCFTCYNCERSKQHKLHTK